MSQPLTAQQARKLMLDAQCLDGTYERSETDDILTKIAAASQQGSDSIIVSSTDSIVQRRLRMLGYSVLVTYDQRDGDFMTITW
jgi:uncharacterized protein YcaQ